MDLNAINSQTSATYGEREAKGKSDLGQQEFLQLLVAQMRHQDPINPLDGAEFASQLAQFNSVEQLINVNSGLETLKGSQEMMSRSLTNTMAASLTGKEVKALNNQIALQAGDSSEVMFRLNGTASEVELRVLREGGTEVYREVLEGVPAGEHTWSWDGRNGLGEGMPDGRYQIEVQASGPDGPVDSLLFTEGSIDRVRYGENGVYLMVNGVEIPVSDVEEVGSAVE